MTQEIIPILNTEDAKKLAMMTESVAADMALTALRTARNLNLKMLLGEPMLDDLQAKVNTSVGIAGATQANPVTITTGKPHRLTGTATVSILNARGMEIDGTWLATVATATTLIIPVDGTVLDPYVAGSATLVVMEAHWAELWLKVRNALAWWTHASLLPFQGVQTREKGVELSGGPESTAANLEQIKALANSCRSNAEAYANDIRRFLCGNSELFPSYVVEDGKTPRIPSKGLGFMSF